VLPSLIDVMAVNYDKKLLLVYQNVIFCERQSGLNMNRVIMLTALLGLNKKILTALGRGGSVSWKC